MPLFKALEWKVDVLNEYVQVNTHHVYTCTYTLSTCCILQCVYTEFIHVGTVIITQYGSTVYLGMTRVVLGQFQHFENARRGITAKRGRKEEKKLD